MPRLFRKWFKPRPESGLDCLMCAEFARKQNSAPARQSRPDSGLGLNRFRYEKSSTPFKLFQDKAIRQKWTWTRKWSLTSIDRAHVNRIVTYFVSPALAARERKRESERERERERPRDREIDSESERARERESERARAREREREREREPVCTGW